MKINKDQVVGRAKEVEGKAKEVAGKVLGNPGLEVRGKTEQVVGVIQKDIGDLKAQTKT